MYLSLSWLKEFLPEIKVSADLAQKIGEKITTHTAETEGIENIGDRYDKIYAAKLIKVEKINEKLHKGIFDLGKIGQKQIVFGSVHPLALNKLYPVALAGAKLKSGIEMKESEIKGVKSAGMVCDNLELGLKNESIVTFSEEKIGQELKTMSEFADFAIEIDNKSLTHRPDLLGHRGFAREVAISLDLKYKEENYSAITLPNKLTDFGVAIKTENCRRFMAVKVENITIQDAPLDERLKLEHCGTRSINSVVDITNLSLLGVGQPMHAFDADKLDGQIVVRQAQKGESLVALDGETYELSPDDVVIADEAKILSIAGVMGGLESGVTAETKNIVFECASFDPVSVRKTSKRLGLRSESSMRYEKNLAPELCDVGLRFALKKMKVFHPESTATRFAEVFASPTQEISIPLEYEKVRNISGLDISDKKIEENLKKLGFEIIEHTLGVMLVKVPKIRATKDIAIEEDLIEEVIRLEGYEAIPETMPGFDATPFAPNLQRRRQHQLRFLCANAGLTEIMTHSLTHKGQVKVANPLSENYTHLRTNLIEPILKNLESELRKEKKVSLFELGRTYHAPLGTEKEKLVILIGEMNGDLKKGVKKAKETLQKVALGLKKELFFENNTETIPDFAHPFVYGNVLLAGSKIGTIGAINAKVSEIKNANIAFAEIEIEALIAKTPTTYQKPGSRQVVTRDISIMIDKEASWSDIASSIENKNQKGALKSVIHDPSFGKAGQKNIVLTMSFAAEEKKLDEQEIGRRMELVLQTLQKNFKKYNAEIR